MEPSLQTVAIPLVLKILEVETDSDTTNTATSEDAFISKLEAARDRLENRLNPIDGVSVREPELPDLSEKLRHKIRWKISVRRYTISSETTT